MTAIWRMSVAAALLCIPTLGWAAGYSIYEQSGRALGMAGAYTATVGDASATYFNPAGLVLIERGDAYVGTSLIFVSREFAGNAPYPGPGLVEEGKSNVFFPTHAFWGHRLGEPTAIGFGFYTPFGLTTEWESPDRFTGRFVSTKARVTPFYFNPTFAYAFDDNFRIGGGVMAVYSTVELRQNVGLVNPSAEFPSILDVGTLKLDGNNSLDWGFNVGLQVDIDDKVYLGITYRSEVKASFEGDADFTFVGTGTPADPQLMALFPQDQKVKTEVPFPATAVLAAAVRANESWLIEGDFGFVDWSAFQSLTIDFQTDDDLDTTRPQNWVDTFFFRLGAEWAPKPGTQVRFGGYYDATPQPIEAVSPLLPDNERWGLSVGVGKDWGRWRGDAFGLLLLIGDRETQGMSQDGFDGTYANAVQILGASVGYRY